MHEMLKTLCLTFTFSCVTGAPTCSHFCRWESVTDTELNDLLANTCCPHKGVGTTDAECAVQT